MNLQTIVKMIVTIVESEEVIKMQNDFVYRRRIFWHAVRMGMNWDFGHLFCKAGKMSGTRMKNWWRLFAESRPYIRNVQ